MKPVAPPVKDGVRPTATAINGEAGQHPVPTDPRELQAAMLAGHQCWARFPYYALRYGERGERFARSDAAWQATLCHYPPDEIEQQVRWLARVLAARGMPSMLLQVQLEMLVVALSQAVPDQQALYKCLLPAAEALRQGRLQHLSEAQTQELIGRFEQAVGPVLTAACPDAALLLCAAVADECEGLPRAVESLHHWLADPARFPPHWIAAVDEVLAAARTAAAAATALAPMPAPTDARGP